MAKKKAETKPQAPKGLQIIALQAENVKRIQLVRVRPKGSIVEIAGPNSSGKSSLLDAIDWALCGTTNIPSQPIRKGERTATIEVDLGEYKVRRHFTKIENGKEPYISKLEVFGPNKERYPSPQALLDGLMGSISFDPLEFVNLDDKKQLEALRKLVKYTVSIEDIDREKQEAYDARRDAGRDLEAARMRLAGIAKPVPDLPEQAIDTADLTRQISEASEKNARRQDKLVEQSKYGFERVQLGGKIDRNKQRIAELEKEIESLQRENAVAQETIDGLRKQQAAVEIPEEISTADLAERLNNATQLNQQIERAKYYRTLEAAVAEQQKAFDELDAKVKAKELERVEALKTAEMPLEGLAIGDKEVLWNGFPFSEASQAEQIRVSVAMAMATNPKLKVLRIKTADLLDDNGLAIIADMAKEGGFQIWMERVHATENVSVVMEEGTATGPDVEKISR